MKSALQRQSTAVLRPDKSRLLSLRSCLSARPQSRLLSHCSGTSHTSSAQQPTVSLAYGSRWSRQTQRRSLATAAGAIIGPKKTPLYDLHLEHGGKMVEFGGHSMPVTYPSQSITESAIWTRQNASIFDVSHMTQHKFSGSGVVAFLESITPSAISDLKEFTSTYSALLNDKAGIVDDTIITNITESEPAYHVVTNAGNHEVDLVYFKTELDDFRKKNPEMVVEWEVLKDTGLIALQGPVASDILESLQPSRNGQAYDLSQQTFGNARWLTFRDPVNGQQSTPVLVARTGYTGEDGFELSIPHAESSRNTTLEITKMILKAGGDDRVKLAGLGARDALRLEAGLCLHGHDINDTTTPVQASLLWIISKSRRNVNAGFKGSQHLYDTKATTVSPVIRRVGMVLEARGPAAREGDKIYSDAECTNEIGTVTSGAPSPSLQKNIAMGYAEKDASKAGTSCWLKVRGKPRSAQFAKMPFVPTKYFKGTLVNPKN